MKKIMSLVILSAIACSLGSCGAQKVDNAAIRNLDVARYLGRWYEIARYDHSFEKGIQNATAMYTLRPDGKITVLNSGWKDGKYRESAGKAFQPDPDKNPARLRVSFFGPFYSDYRVLMLSPDYDYALVGSKSSKYLWILSRTPEMPYSVRDKVLAEAQRRGYDTEKLIWVDQSVNIAGLVSSEK